MIKFGQIAKARRKSAGLSQQQVCDALELSHRSDVHRRETGKVKWSLDDVIRLAALLGITVSELVKDLSE
jgi:transcriptional regulator with XRE-family HTH domain